jgi:phosphate transport system permease protein
MKSITSDLHQKRSLKERWISAALFACAAVSIVVTAGIVAVLLFETAGFFKEVTFAQFFLDTQWTPHFAQKHFGIWPLVAGTALTSFFAMITAVPMGLLVAVFLSEYAPERVRRILKPVIEILAGIPTVVYGYFALTFVTPLLQKFIPDLAGFNSLGPGLVMGIMITPIVASLSEDAIYSVPSSLREGALALGATRLRTLRHVILPTAFSGIAASFILGISRAVGETMIVAIAAGQQPVLTLDPRVPIETMTAYIVQVSLGDTPHGSLEYSTIFVVGSMLFILTLAFNLAALYLRKKILKGAI